VKSFRLKVGQWFQNSTPLVGGVLIVVGIVLALFAGSRIFTALTVEESPFDQVDAEGRGFIPLLDLAAASEQAPALPVSLATPQETRATPAVTEASSMSDAAPVHTSEIPQTPTPVPALIPDRIVIPTIDLDAPVVAAGTREIEYLEQTYEQWLAPNDFAAGWHTTSAKLGIPGNTVLNGHHNVYGEVFKDLVNLEVGDMVFVYSGNRVFMYQIATKLILKERWQPVEVRMENARWLQPSSDERLTLVTCWPYDSNTHRLILAARPVRSFIADEPELEQLISPDQPEQN